MEFSFRKTLHIRDIHRAHRRIVWALTISTLGINNRANGDLGITLQLGITSEATNFITQILESWQMAGALL
jgi:hypothetical protein